MAELVDGSTVDGRVVVFLSEEKTSGTGTADKKGQDGNAAHGAGAGAHGEGDAANQAGKKGGGTGTGPAKGTAAHAKATTTAHKGSGIVAKGTPAEGHSNDESHSSAGNSGAEDGQHRAVPTPKAPLSKQGKIDASKTQAEALAAAAKGGTPFCEECAELQREHEAARKKAGART